jgi:hypothetical protein
MGEDFDGGPQAMRFNKHKAYLKKRALDSTHAKIMRLRFQGNTIIIPYLLDGAPITDTRTLKSGQKEVVDYCRFRDLTKNDDHKFTQYTGTGVHYYFPPLSKRLRKRYGTWAKILANPKIRLIITEGEFKAAALMYHSGIPCIAIAGKDSYMALELDKLNLKGREFELLPDSDFERKDEVRQAFLTAGDTFAEHGGIPHLGRLPTLSGMRVTGADDYVAACGAAEFTKPAEQRFHVPVHAWDSQHVADIRSKLPGLMSGAAFKVEEHMESFYDLLKRDVAPVRYVRKGMLARGASSLVGGPQKGMKSTLLHYWALVAAGALKCTWSKFKPTKKRLRVAYIDLQQSDTIGKKRISEFRSFDDFKPTEAEARKQFVRALKRIKRIDKFPPLDSVGLQKLEELIVKYKLDWVIFDTGDEVRPYFRHVSAREADLKFMTPVTELAHRLRCAITVIVQTGKNPSEDPTQRLAATSGLPAAVDDVLILSKPKEADMEHKGDRYLTITGRHIEEFGTYMIRRTARAIQYVGDATELNVGNAQQRILTCLKLNGESSPAQIAKYVGMPSSNVVRALNSLIEHNRVVITPDGKRALPAQVLKEAQRK